MAVSGGVVVGPQLDERIAATQCLGLRDPPRRDISRSEAAFVRGRVYSPDSPVFTLGPSCIFVLR